MNDHDDLDPIELQHLLDAAASLPREATLEQDPWPAIRDRIEAQRVRPISAGVQTPQRSRRTFWYAAAGILIVALSGTVSIVQQNSAAPDAAIPHSIASAPAAAEPAPTAPAIRVHNAAELSIDALFSHYDAAATDLTAALAQRRATLDPATVAVVDSCISRIDAAIAEARVALKRDPRNAVINELLTAAYAQKLDLLKRAAGLPSRSL